ncbi:MULTISPECIES: DoxX family protein [unclassified Pseudoclavibacter]|uniref:DoxX family protein n=1 Tax=unclassified Pseudoclavibacter TaxID=2615177 RepID=UPI001BA84826|nr:DoxX family protein [Pseudoclavibacter sp. Marseille-Q4354]MBS3178310.1 DoxX family protein [Pseudoclavibacter sp. Marseille-Q4354]
MSSSANAALLILRLALGATMLLHGIQKLTTTGIGGVQEMLGSLGIPLADVAGAALPFVEIVAGALLIVGLFTRVAAALLAVVSLGAMFTVHFTAGFFAQDGGYEFVLVLALVGIALVLTGGGRWAADALIRRPRSNRESHPESHSERRSAAQVA